MEIKILGPGCAKCTKTEKLIREVIQEMGSDATVEKVTDMMEIAAHGVFSTPAVVIDKEVKCAGKIPAKDAVKKWLS
jgi:small redox-active disulfide protein 2